METAGGSPGGKMVPAPEEDAIDASQDGDVEAPEDGDGDAPENADVEAPEDTDDDYCVKPNRSGRTISPEVKALYDAMPA